jgi:hypothetical protein
MKTYLVAALNNVDDVVASVFEGSRDNNLLDAGIKVGFALVRGEVDACAFHDHLAPHACVVDLHINGPTFNYLLQTLKAQEAQEPEQQSSKN